MDIFLFLIAFAIFGSFVRLFIGPNFADRIAAFDIMGIMTISLLVLLSIYYKNPLYLDVAFIFALIGFIGTILFARFNILRGKDA